MPQTWQLFTRQLTRFCAVFVLISASATFSGAEEPNEAGVRIATFASDLGASLEYDPFLEIGRLSYGGDSVRFAVGSDEMYIDDGRVLTVQPPVRDNGDVYLSQTTVESLHTVWRPEATDRDEPHVAAIFIDPGHGGRDPGTIGRHEIDGETLVVQEKDVVLDVSLQLRDKLQASFPNRNIILSREDDRYLSLDERTEMANEIPLGENEYIVFVSVHANASFNTRARGFEAWYLPPEQRRTLIDPEELDEDRRRIHAILNSMREEEVSVHSAMLGTSILEGLDSAVGEQSPNRGLLQENWAVVRNALMPSILVELGFVTNTEEAILLSDDNYLNKLAAGLYTGISQFIQLFEASDASGT